MTAVDNKAPAEVQKFSLTTLTAMVVGSMAGAMESVVGVWGTAFISVGVVVSVLGAYLAWTLMSAEVLFVADKARDMPSLLARTNARKAPAPAVLMTSILIQLALVITLFSQDAFTSRSSCAAHCR